MKCIFKNFKLQIYCTFELKKQLNHLLLLSKACFTYSFRAFEERILLIFSGQVYHPASSLDTVKVRQY